jgi:phthalate 4,5-cis-dihydrodiol dehydrogenase
MTHAPIRLGIVGLGRAFTIMLPTFLKDPRIRLVGATDRVAAARARFESDFVAPTYDTVEALCSARDVDAIYVATPHELHADHVCVAVAAGKHVLVEKPMSITLESCTRMIEAARAAGVHIIVGPSHSFDKPIQRTREIIESGRYGSVRMITATNFTDFLYRPRRPEELRTAEGGGAIHNQAAHQIDIVRLLGGGLVRSVRAHTGSWDPERPTEGAYSALLGFDGGAFCSTTYSGFGHYDSDVLMDWIGEVGQKKNAADYGVARRQLRNVGSVQEAELKAQGNYGGKLWAPPVQTIPPLAYEHFGHIVVSCDKADLRPTATGVEIYDDDRREVELLPPPTVPRAEVIDELHDVVVKGYSPLHSGEWARATTEVCLAILESMRKQADVRPAHQVPVPQQVAFS